MTTSVYQQRVKDVVSRDVVAIHAADNVHEALVLLTENRVSALPVVDGHDRCVGMLSTTDLIDLTREIDDEIEELSRDDGISREWLVDRLKSHVGDTNVMDLMTDNAASVDPERPLVDAAREMLRHRVHRLPVVDQRGRLQGIISTMDILRAFVEGNQED